MELSSFLRALAMTQVPRIHPDPQCQTATLLTDPGPVLAGADEFYRSRDACASRSAHAHRIFPLSAPIFARECRRWSQQSHDPCFKPRCKPRKKKEAERRKTLIRILRNLAIAARAGDSALACRRSTAALARGTPVPKAQVQARLPGTWFPRALPAVACPSPVAAPHAPVVMPASMMPGPAREWQ